MAMAAAALSSQHNSPMVRVEISIFALLAWPVGRAFPCRSFVLRWNFVIEGLFLVLLCAEMENCRPLGADSAERGPPERD